MATTSSSETTFTVRRLTVAVPDVRGFQRSYEAAVPEVPHAMLSAPLRTVIWEDSSGGAWFTVDQPSTQSGSVGLPEVSTVGVELERKLAGLLDTLDVDVPGALLQS